MIGSENALNFDCCSKHHLNSSLLSLTAYQRIYSSKDISLGMMMLRNYILSYKNQYEYRGTKYMRGRGHFQNPF